MKKSIWSVIILIMVVFLSSCQTNTADSKENLEIPEFNSKVIIYEEPNNKQAVGALMYCTSVDGISYAFEDGITEDERIKCIESTHQLLKRISLEDEVKNDISINICLREKHADTYIANKVLRTYSKDYTSIEYTTDLLLTIYGEFCNYGVAYGYAKYLIEGITKGSANFVFDSSNGLSILDLNLLCFNASFVSASEIEKARFIATKFVADYISNNSENALKQLLVMSGDVENNIEFTNALSKYYLKNGIDYLLSDVLYGFGGTVYDYSVKSKYAIWYIEKEWKPRSHIKSSLEYDGFLHRKYADVKQFFETNTKQMLKYQELFNLGSYDNDVKIFVTNSGTKSFYNLETRSINVIYIEEISHEYIHSLSVLDIIKNDAKWSVEGLAEFFSNYYNYYLDVMYDELNNSPEFLEKSTITAAYRNYLNRDIKNETDFFEMMEIYSFLCDEYDPNKNYYKDGASFVGYLVTKYGEKEFLRKIDSNEIVGDTYVSLCEEWKKYLINKYSKEEWLQPFVHNFMNN